jgi:hypothetical protein
MRHNDRHPEFYVTTPMEVGEELCRCIDLQRSHPQHYLEQQGWVLIAFGNALYRLLHAVSLEEALVETVGCGGDVNTDAAIAGALLGPVHGREAVPERWTHCLLHCRPAALRPDVERPRPEVFWPIDSLELARMVLLAGASENPMVIREEPREYKVSRPLDETGRSS